MGSDTPNDFINSEGVSIQYSTDYSIKESKRFFFNSSFRQKNSFSDLQTSASYPSYSQTSLKNYQITPRINEKNSLFGKNVNSNYGLDILYADYESQRKKNKSSIPKHTYNAWQSSQSAYIQQSITLNQKSELGIGARLQRNSIGIGDVLNNLAPNYSAWDKEHVKFLDSNFNYASNIGLNYKLTDKIKIFGRYSTGFRYPNIDDRIGGSGDTSLDLKTQTTNDYEIGSNINIKNHKLTVTSYLIDSKNELGYDSDHFENINIDSTRRFGLEFSSKSIFLKNIVFKNNLSFTKAKFTSENQGKYATSFKGMDVPLVPQFSLDTSLDIDLNKYVQFKPSLKFQDDMRMESDDENFQDTKIPGYTIANIELLSNFNKFQLSLGITNLLDHKYFNYAVASSSTKGVYNAYPEAGREVYLSIKSNF